MLHDRGVPPKRKPGAASRLEASGAAPPKRRKDQDLAGAIGRIHLDTSRFPVVLLTESGPQASAQDFMDAFDSLLALNRRFVSLHDARASSGWDVIDRAGVHDWLKRNAATLRKLVIAHGAIVTGVGQRSNAAAVFWGTGLDRAVRYFEEPTAAEVWAFKAAHSRRGVSAG